MFLEEKERIKKEHRQECHSAFRSIFGKDPCRKADFVVINFFALVHLLNTLSFVPGLIVSALSLSIDLNHVAWHLSNETKILNDGYTYNHVI